MARHSIRSAVRTDLLWIAAALLAGIGVYSQVPSYDFVDWDDPGYILNNPHTLAGLSPENALWALTSFGMSNWHPLTLMSHMLDVDLWGLWPGGHHLTSLLWHLANTALLHAFLRRAGAEAWRAGIAAMLFAVHPLHVESVAWVSERKDVLSGFFWLLTLLLYQGYARTPTVTRYLAVIAAFALGLTAKPMLVTLPLLLLVLDYWPLRRFGHHSAGSPSLLPLVAEKLPLLALSAVAAALTLTAQTRAGAVADLIAVPFGERLAAALVAYWRYLFNAILPLDLHYLYERGEPTPLWQALAAAVGLLTVSAAALRWRERQPAWIVGWLWFLGTLVPVIGLVQVGNHAIADRYMYMPIVGLLMALCWSLPPAARGVTLASSAVALLALGLQAHALTASWNSSLDLYRRAVDVSPRHCRAGVAYANQQINAGHFDLARERLDMVLANCPGPALQSAAHALKGKLEQHAGNPERAIATFRTAIARWPQDPAAHVRLGALFMELGRYDEAITPLRTGLAILGPDLHGRNMLAEALARSSRSAEAVPEILAWLRRRPQDPMLWFFYGLANERAGALDVAIGAYGEATRRASGEAQPRLHLGAALAATGRNTEARRELLEVLRIDPGNARARKLLQGLAGSG